ncbi:hypothetical protein A3D80_04615 [Candidatus Roizmanbacteria bacterium RIFCSPHIGHO2_02_FULL_40_13b]|uniref:Uncharacterized protein n=1 Tax=Candidatus Roizmanbacteria bacterium RIFCSPHIGHO2_01_FULL_39_24 TaxID=1802032 RepID=A0A1F7GET5_9BACT|nr:MAG: hypothetical protein A2799_01685 [Candidatus Roizmanbacteria bacterium RIFCSPHIGHO2_01_FULL_39_24]OGK27886.1 MAG: hypothetical protein A3D80_04615 [Candidatus Roizmanbacteria bacterium RIFCSPHIGHO2_02_FULL_40_13b]OGK57257.1 MAG: hypothetical protein A3H83_02035 [Candidatus Roizmanbacteria bacterium RIFCSPLOWO2_02_FULL_39_8]
MYLGPFYFDTREVFLLLAGFLIVLANFFSWNILAFDNRTLLTLIIFIFITGALLPAIHKEAFFTVSMVALFLTLYLTLFQVILFYLLTFLFLRIFKVI